MAELSILFVGDRKMSHLNGLYRGINKTTDVLSFSQIREKKEEVRRKKGKVRSEKCEVRRKKSTAAKNVTPFSTSHFTLHSSHFLLGDVVISVPKAESQAADAGIGFYDEVRRLLIHGILHLLGYDHAGSYYRARKMRKKEEEIFNAT